MQVSGIEGQLIVTYIHQISDIHLIITLGKNVLINSSCNRREILKEKNVGTTFTSSVQSYNATPNNCLA